MAKQLTRKQERLCELIVSHPEFSHEQAAVEAALEMARPGDQVVIFAHKIQRTWDQIVSFVYDGSTVE